MNRKPERSKVEIFNKRIAPLRADTARAVSELKLDSVVQNAFEKQEK